MAVGDAVNSAPTSVAAGAAGTIRPGAGVSWVLHNIYYGGACTINWTDGTNPIPFMTDTTAGALMGAACHVSNGNYITLGNAAAGTIYMAYDGKIEA